VQKWFYDGVLVSRFAGLKKNVPITALFPACAGSMPQYRIRSLIRAYLLLEYVYIGIGTSTKALLSSEFIPSGVV
jgi:hypothetical protein